jgi:hypothetical protein
VAPGESGASHSGTSSRAQLAPGAAWVSVSERGVTVRANRASLRAVLAELERSAGFRLALAPGTQLAKPVTLEAVDAKLEEVLGSLLEGWPHALYYGVAAAGGRVLERVEVGVFSSANEVAAAEVAAADPSAETRTEVSRPRRQRERNVQRDPVAEAERREQREQREAEYFTQLGDSDPAVRAQAAGGLPADEHTVPALSELATNDPDAGVRKAAVSALSDASEEDSVALGALLGALGDSDPQVVIAALDSIEWVGDASAIPNIEPLLEHPNAEVREAAGNAIESLED